MKSTTKLQLSILALSSITAIAFFAILALAASVFWTSDSDWSGDTFSNTTSINGDLISIGNWTPAGESQAQWQYRKAIVVNGSTSLQNDYQIMINLTNRTAASDNFNFAHANSQGNDTRFTWLNTSSGLEQNILFWIENWTSSGAQGNATLWVKAPNVTASTDANTTLYLYYGNPSASSASNGVDTFVIYDDHNDNVLNPALWTVMAGFGSCPEGTTSHEDTGQYERTTGCWDDGARNQRDFTFTNTVDLTTSTIKASLRSSNGGYGIFRNLTIIGATSHSYAMPNDATWRTYLLYKSGGNIIITENGVAVLSEADANNVFTYRHSMRGDGNTWIDQDYFLVRKYAFPEPSVLSIGAEQTKT